MLNFTHRFVYSAAFARRMCAMQYTDIRLLRERFSAFYSTPDFTPLVQCCGKSSKAENFTESWNINDLWGHIPCMIFMKLQGFGSSSLA